MLVGSQSWLTCIFFTKIWKRSKAQHISLNIFIGHLLMLIIPCTRIEVSEKGMKESDFDWRNPLDHRSHHKTLKRNNGRQILLFIADHKITQRNVKKINMSTLCEQGRPWICMALAYRCNPIKNLVF